MLIPQLLHGTGRPSILCENFRMMAIKGIRRVVRYYAFGLIVALIVHFLIGWENKLFMPRSFIVVILLALIALPWAFLNMLNLLFPRSRPQNLAELLTHGIFLLLIVVVALRVW